VMRKLAAAAVIAAAALAGSVVQAQPADAARMINWNHSGASQRGSATVYSGWSCNGASDLVPRGTESEIDPASVKLYKGYSFWRIKTDGTKVKITGKQTRDRCMSYTGFTRRVDAYWAHRLGDNWGAG
jgi:opacity protein-like surface antigen